MTTFKKFYAFFAAVIFAALIPSSLFALPGIITDTPDASGQYIFYRDSSFESDTYIGFLVYDETTIALRVFSSNTDITTYIRLDPTADYISIIGETFPDYLTDSQIETINYAHDMLYELAGRRKHLNGLDLSKDLYLTQEFLQFGGNVNLCWQFYIPLFNLRTITSEAGEPLFEAVTMGVLKSSEDTSFQDFVGFTDTPPSLLAAKKIPDADKDLDDKWFEQIPLIRTMHNQPVIHVAVPVQYPGDFTGFIKEQARESLQSMGGSYVYLPNCTLTFTGDSLYSKVLYTPAHDDTEDNWTCAIRKIKPLDEAYVAYQELNCYTDYYRQHSAYLEDMLVRWDAVLSER